jgi:uncharacterized protein
MTSMNPVAPAAPTSPAIGPTSKSERGLAPDLIRGVALSAIPLGNVGYYLWGDTVGYGSPPAGTLIERFLDVVVQLLFPVAVPVFAIVLGWGLATTARRLAARGMPRRQVLVVLARRDLILITIGALHATLLFGHDILAIYGFAGLVALLLIYRSRRVLVTWAAVGMVLLGVAYLLAGTGYVHDRAHQTTSGSAQYAVSIGERLGPWLGDIAFMVMAGLMLAPFIIGFWLSRTGILDRPWDHVGRLRTIAVAGVTVNIVAGLPAALILASLWTPPTWVVFIVGPMFGLSSLAGGLGFVSLFALIAARLKDRRPAIPAAIAAVGERSLSCYLLQSLILAPLLAAWGLGLGGRVNHLGAYGIAAAVALINIAVAGTLARAKVRGPMEALSRRLTYRRPATTATARDATDRIEPHTVGGGHQRVSRPISR